MATPMHVIRQSFNRFYGLPWLVLMLVSLGLFLVLLAMSQPIALASQDLAPLAQTPTMAAPDTTSAAANGFDSMLEAQANLIPKIREFYGGKGMYRGIVPIFFLLIGPIKIIPAFAKLTTYADASLRRRLAFRGFLFSTIATLLCALLGYNLLSNYNIPLTAVVAAAGLLLTLVALRIVMSQYGDVGDAEPPPENPTLDLVLQPLVFPSILSPYGLAVVITMSATARAIDGNLHSLLIILIAIMGVNWVTMLYAHKILKYVKPLVLQAVGLVLGIIQLALGLGLIFSALELQALVLRELLTL